VQLNVKIHAKELFGHTFSITYMHRRTIYKAAVHIT